MLKVLFSDSYEGIHSLHKTMVHIIPMDFFNSDTEWVALYLEDIASYGDRYKSKNECITVAIEHLRSKGWYYFSDT